MRDDPRSELVAEYRRIGHATFAFTSRKGGVSKPPYDTLNLGLHVGDDESAVWENRRRALQALGVEDRIPVEAEQVHGGEVGVTTRETLSNAADGRAVYPGVDALVTGEPRLLLAFFYADCMPIFVADDAGTAIGLAYAGHRVGADTVAAMCGVGVDRWVRGTRATRGRSGLGRR